MNIALNARFLKFPYTGIGQYTYNLARELQRYKKHTFFFLCPERIKQESFPNNNFIPEPRLVNKSLKKYLWETRTIPAFCRHNKIDIMHHLYPVSLGKMPYRQIVTIHDAIPWSEKKYRSSIKTRLYHYMVGKNMKYADRIIAVSNTTKQDIIFFLKEFPLDKIRVIYEAQDPLYEKRLNKEDAMKICGKYGIKRDFFLYVGGYDPRKNVKTIVKAFLQGIAPRFPIDLVLIGGKILNQTLYDDFEKLKKYAKGYKIKIKGTIHFPGFIDKEDLAALYQTCSAFINLSLKEGFNIPLCEAASSSTPLILSNTPIHREISHENALFCDLNNGVEQCIKAMERIIKGSGLHHELAHRAIDIAKHYSWQKTAEKTLSLYEELNLCHPVLSSRT